MKRVALLLLVLTTAIAVAQQNPFPNAPPEEEAALKERVNGFYSTFQQGQFREAEAFVAEESREVYYNAPKTRIFSYEIRSLEFNRDLNEASVLVGVESLSPLSAQPLKQPLQSHWKRIDGEWYMLLKGLASGEDYQTPVGPMHFPDTVGKDGARPANFRQPNLASMQTAYEVSGRNLKFSSDGSAPETHTIRVKNKFQTALTIERLTRDFPGMEIKIESETISPDSEVTIAFTYHPEQARLAGNKQFDFDLMPITQRVRVVLSFR
ncbi:MAG: hypothetical protein WD733_23910 [Bryobacterales bacterium]